MSFFGNLSELFGAKADEASSNIKTQNKKPIRSKKAKNNHQNKNQAQGQNQKNKSNNKGQNQPKQNIDLNNTDAVREAKAKAREIIIEAKDEALALRSKAERQQRQISQKLEDQQRELNKKLDKIDLKLEQLAEKENRLENDKNDLEKLKKETESQRQNILAKLEKVSGLTRDEAEKMLLDGMGKKISKQMAQVVKQKEEEAKAEADEKAQEIIVDAMKHGATDYIAEYTVSVVEIPNEEAKGKIIGKSGRNIHAFEKITGVDVDLDYSEKEVRLSCFDPVRREIARIALQRLIKDGRIQPTRIEEVVAKVKTEIDKTTLEAGKKLCHDVGVYNLPTDLMRMLGRFKYRFSYGQNLIKHTLEETKIGIKIAHEVGADVTVVKLGCLLHDIGKVSDDVEGSHVELGVKIAKKYGMSQPVIDCIAQHHEDEAFSGVEQMIVYIADAISGARPGARYEDHEGYVERLEQLEEIAMTHKGVKQAYAIQAGREIRVLLDPEKTKDNDVIVLATQIRDEIKEKMTYPGTVTVNVSREVRDNKVAA